MKIFTIVVALAGVIYLCARKVLETILEFVFRVISLDSNLFDRDSSRIKKILNAICITIGLIIVAIIYLVTLDKTKYGMLRKWVANNLQG